MPRVERKVWRENFGEWFRDVLFKAQILDYRYPIKGVGVWPPYGMKIRNKVISIIKELLDSTGHEEVLFPTLIPEDFIRKESEHIAKFEEEIFWVTKGGKSELEARYALRPTSETAIMPMIRLWIHSHADLPLKIYQVVNIFRCETKATQPMIRLREVMMFKEAHTVHATREEAEEQVREAIGIYKKFFDSLGISYLISQRPEWDKFAGAVYTIAFDTIMPDGKTLQIGTVHYLGQNFSRAFDVTYLTPEGVHEYAHTTSYGISERVIAALVALHGDDIGLVLHPAVAPIEAVVIPIPAKEGGLGVVVDKCREARERLEDAGFSVILDEREDMTPGEKFYYWDRRGIPVRVEIGPRDVERGAVTLVRRDTLEREEVPEGDLAEEVGRMLRDIGENLRKRAWEWLESNFSRHENLDDARRTLASRGGVVEVPWCGREECGHKIEEALEGEALGVDLEETADGEPCAICGSTSARYLRVSKRY